MNDKDVIEVFIKNRIRQSGSWLHIKNKQLKEWIKDECQHRQYNEKIVEEILNELLP
jgi:NADPH-dependent 7-cyano-7-deazaguanine reductase QueF